MNEKELKTLATQLNTDFLTLQKIFTKFRPKDRTELIKLTNEIKSLQGELNTQDIDQVIDFYQSRQQDSQQNEQSDEIKPQEGSQETQNTQLMSQEQNMSQVQPASINFDSVYQQGYKFNKSDDKDLKGECAWFAEQITRLPDGSNWTIGSTIEEKRNQLNGHKSKGNGFLRGEGQPEVGNSIVIDTGTPYGHVAVISEVLPDGRVRLTESNWDNDTTVRHDRIIDPNGEDVIGFVKSKPTQEFQVGQPKTDPNTPSTQEVSQPKIDAPQGKQELPVEQQPVKPEDVDAQNENAKLLEKETKLPPEELKQVVAVETQPVENVDTQTKVVEQVEPQMSQEGNVGFLDVFSKDGKPITPQQPTAENNDFINKIIGVLPESQRSDALKALPGIVDALDAEGILNEKTLGYAVATVGAESGFVPKEEIMARRGINQRNDYIAGLQENYDGGTDYRGRGYIQLTHKSNYDKYGQRIGEDLVNNPDKLLDPNTSAKVLAAYMKDSGVADAVNRDDYNTARVRVQGRGALNPQFIENTNEITNNAKTISNTLGKDFLKQRQQPKQETQPDLIKTFSNNLTQKREPVEPESLQQKIPKVNLPIFKPEIKKLDSFINKPTVQPTSVMSKPQQIFKQPTRNVAPVQSRPAVQQSRPQIQQSRPQPRPVMTPARQPVRMSVAPQMSRQPVQQAPRQSVGNTLRNTVNKVANWFRR